MAGLTSVFAVGQMQMTDYQNRQSQQSQQSGTKNTNTTQDLDSALSLIRKDVPAQGGNISAVFSIAQMQMVDYQNAQDISKNISEKAPQMDMNDYLELKDKMPVGGGNSTASVFSVAQMQMVDYQNAQSLYRMADTGLLDQESMQQMLDSGEFEGTVYAQVAEQILNGDTEALEAWNFQDAERDLPAPTGNIPLTGNKTVGGSGALSSVFSIARMQMVDYQNSSDLDKMARNGLIDTQALQERYDNGDLTGMYNATAARILAGEEG